jgi:hypothetical protein
MRTSDLILRLTNNLTPIESNFSSKRLNRALSVGMASSTVLLVVLYGIRSDMPELLLTTMFWVRLAFPVTTLIAALNLAGRLGRPGAPVRLAWLAVTLPFITMLLAATFMVFATPPGYRLQLMLGTTCLEGTRSRPPDSGRDRRRTARRRARSARIFALLFRDVGTVLGCLVRTGHQHHRRYRRPSGSALFEVVAWEEHQEKSRRRKSGFLINTGRLC